MSFMWHADRFQAEARSTAVTVPAAEIADIVDRRLRAQVWGTLLAANLVASIAGLWFVGAAIF